MCFPPSRKATKICPLAFAKYTSVLSPSREAAFMVYPLVVGKVFHLRETTSKINSLVVGKDTSVLPTFKGSFQDKPSSCWKGIPPSREAAFKNNPLLTAIPHNMYFCVAICALFLSCYLSVMRLSIFFYHSLFFLSNLPFQKQALTSLSLSFSLLMLENKQLHCWEYHILSCAYVHISGFGMYMCTRVPS